MQRCPRCQRANPPDASFCHNDGIPLDTVHMYGTDYFKREWRFPSGRICRTLDELAKGCLKEWTEARKALIRKDFTTFFQENNRPDLARLVPSAEPDAEIAMQTLLEKLPCQVKATPSVDVAPRRLLIPNVRRGDDRKVILNVLNRGSGLLHGDLIVPADARWLKANTTKVRARSEQAIELTIDTRALSASGSYFTRLQIRTNGGAIEVPIQVDYTVDGVPFQGHHVTDPQDLARIMLAKPKLGAKWLADGSVRRLFAAQGWDYPLRDPLAPALGAVQQYFEALGLSTIPRVSVDAAGFEVTCDYPEMVSRAVTLSTKSKKWIYAFVDTSTLWIKPRESVFAGGRRVDVVFDIDSELLEPGQVHDGVLQLTVNGGVEHSVWVRVDVRRPFEPWTRKIMKPFMG